jgi:hypothetical protein
MKDRWIGIAKGVAEMKDTYFSPEAERKYNTAVTMKKYIFWYDAVWLL